MTLPNQFREQELLVKLPRWLRCDCAFRNASVLGGSHCVSVFCFGLDLYSLVDRMKRRLVGLGLKAKTK